jgi:hypothetical protein
MRHGIAAEGVAGESSSAAAQDAIHMEHMVTMRLINTIRCPNKR